MTDSRAIENNPFKELGEIPKLKYSGEYDIQHIHITVRDGTKIAATIVLPKNLPEGAKLPSVLTQTRYWRARKLRIPFRWILDELTTDMPNSEIITSRGYAFIIIDVRGTGASFGKRIIPFSDDEVMDGADIVDWIISQPWSDGNVVSKGISYTGTTAELLAANCHPAVKAVMPGHGFWDPYTDVAFPGGVYDNAFMQLWSFLGKNLDLNNPKVFREIMPEAWLFVKSVQPVDVDIDGNLLKEAVDLHRQNRYVHENTIDKDHRDESLPEGYTIYDVSVFKREQLIEKSGVPILAWCSWYDSGYVDAVIHRFLNYSNPFIGILGDWNHGAHEEANQFFPERKIVCPSPRERIHAWMNFFDKCLYGDGWKQKIIYYYTLVEEKWKKTTVWPPLGCEYQRWYFSKDLSIRKEKPNESSGQDEYKVNFRATSGRNNRWWALLGLPIIYEGRSRMDEKLLCYESQPFERDVEITGQAIICLYMSSTNEDGAIFLYLEDVDEQGNVTYITDGEFRPIHRKVSDEEAPFKMIIPYHTFKKNDAKKMTSGEIVEVKFGLHATSVLIKKQHRIRIAIAGEDKDTFKRYPEDGRPIITILRNSINASYIDIPIIKKENQGG
ncbi:MAG: CocE/NonD family hydrolase [Candidatus Hermodarchaeota archaeon]